MKIDIERHANTGELYSVYDTGHFTTLHVHLGDGSALGARVAEIGDAHSPEPFGYLTFGPASIHCDPELAKRIGAVLADWRAEQAAHKDAAA